MLHRDHVNTFDISIEALWHAGGPVCAALGPSWATPEIYLYKDAPTGHEPFGVSVKGFGHKSFEALATQESQFTLFGQYFGVGSREEFAREIERLKREGGRDVEYFWVARDVLAFDVLPESSAHRLKDWSPVSA
jgi:LmbE family N-acetylglucosaminyl deacetylase